MVNPETLPCSIEQLFYLPTSPTPEPALTATVAKPILDKPNAAISSRRTVVDPVIEPMIAPKLRVVAGEPKMIVNKVEKGLSTGWWVVIICAAAISVGIFLVTQHKHSIEQRKEKDPPKSN